MPLDPASSRSKLAALARVHIAPAAGSGTGSYSRRNHKRIFVKSWQKNEAEKTPVHPGKSLSPWTWTRVRERYAHGGMAQEGRRLLWPPPLRYGLVMENLIRSSMHLDYGRLRAPFWCVWGVGTRVHKPKLYH